MKGCFTNGRRAALALTLVLGVLSVSCDGASSPTTTAMFGVVSPKTAAALLDVRGGARKKKSRTGSLNSKTVTGKKKVGAKKAAEKKPESMGNALSDWYNQIPRFTKIYVNMIVACTVLGLLLGEERAQSVLALDPMRLIYGLELWRPFTAASFLGKQSISWLMSGYYLYEYGASLEIRWCRVHRECVHPNRTPDRVVGRVGDSVFYTIRHHRNAARPQSGHAPPKGQVASHHRTLLDSPLRTDDQRRPSVPGIPSSGGSPHFGDFNRSLLPIQPIRLAKDGRGGLASSPRLYA